MSDQTLLVFRKRLALELVPVDAWTLAPRGRLQWLQRLAWRFLERMCALKRYSRNDEVERRELIDHTDLMGRVLAAKRWAFDECRGVPRHILIGADDFAELMTNPQMQREFARFQVQFPGGVDRRPVMLELTWHVLPWMQGFVVLPEDW